MVHFCFPWSEFLNVLVRAILFGIFGLLSVHVGSQDFLGRLSVRFIFSTKNRFLSAWPQV